MSKHRSVRALVVLSFLVVTVAAIVGKDVQDFRIRDDCDPATFNAGPPNGPGAGVICDPAFDGDTTFAEFIEELTEDGTIGSWRFNPDSTRLDRGQGTLLESRAGEIHTFTKVAKFGGGIIPLLNDLTNAGAIAAECVTAVPPPDADPKSTATSTNFVILAGERQEGPVAGSAELPKGKTRWQCCIHPWMRSEITVR
jgi:hypothetical protein